MTNKTRWAAAALLALAGCAGEDQPQTTDNVASPSEGARINNQNPTTPTIDVPATSRDESANSPANQAPAGARPGEAESADPKTGGAETPPVVPSPGEPTPDANSGSDSDKDDGARPEQGKDGTARV